MMSSSGNFLLTEKNKLKNKNKEVIKKSTDDVKFDFSARKKTRLVISAIKIVRVNCIFTNIKNKVFISP